MLYFLHLKQLGIKISIYTPRIIAMTSSTQEWFLKFLHMNVLTLFRICPSYNAISYYMGPPCPIFDGFFIDTRVATMTTWLQILMYPNVLLKWPIPIPYIPQTLLHLQTIYIRRCTPKLLVRLKMSLSGSNNGIVQSSGHAPSSQHQKGQRGCVEAPGWD